MKAPDLDREVFVGVRMARANLDVSLNPQGARSAGSESSRLVESAARRLNDREPRVRLGHIVEMSADRYRKPVHNRSWFQLLEPTSANAHSYDR